MALHPNALRYEGDERDHVERYFLKAVAPDSQRALWISASLTSSGPDLDNSRAEGWAMAFDQRDGASRQHVAVKHRVPIGRASFASDGLDIAWSLPEGDRFVLSAGHSGGTITTGQDRLHWSLRFDGEPRPFLPLPSRFLYRRGWPGMTTAWPSVWVDGSVEVGNEVWKLDGWRGMQGHHWGPGHGDYLWCHCNHWQGRDELTLEAVTLGTPWSRGRVTLICVRYGGVDYIFNGPLDLLRNTADCTLRSYSFAAQNRQARLNALVEASEAELTGLHRPDPDGVMTHCLTSALARARVRFEPRSGAAVDLDSRAAALQINTPKSDHGVAMLL